MRRLRRFLLAVVGTALVVLAAFGVWIFGRAQFNEDYCFTEVEIPAGDPEFSPPEWEFPMTYRCDFGEAGVVSVNEPRPVLGTAALGGVTVLSVSAIWWWIARHPAPRRSKQARSPAPEYEGKHHA